jgi:hypothetical protein
LSEGVPQRKKEEDDNSAGLIYCPGGQRRYTPGDKQGKSLPCIEYARLYERMQLRTMTMQKEWEQDDLREPCEKALAAYPRL